tara:strand:- start:148 stop:630 length:483 start_codon:yes stop_codon:yes gene_type:complete
MGSGTSKQLKCPADYDKDKFKRILILYDRLDSNGDHIVETKELDKIAELHFINKIRKMKEYILKIENDAIQKSSKLEQDATFKISSINTQLMLDIKNNKNKKADDVMCANRHIEKMNKMDDVEKTKKFRKAVSDDKGHIHFWTFYEYMKDRTDDIVNIVW